MHELMDPYRPLPVEDLAVLYTSYRTRYTERDDRIDIMDRVVSGELNVFDPDEDNVDSRSPNMIQVALEDTAESASVAPNIRVTPSRDNREKRASADAMERIATHYMDFCRWADMRPLLAMDLLAFGLSAVTITPDFSCSMPRVERRDPRTCYPEPGWRPGDITRRCVFARDIKYSQMPERWKTIAENFVIDTVYGQREAWGEQNTDVTIVEYYDEYEIVVAAMFNQGRTTYLGSEPVVNMTPVELERYPHNYGTCPVVVGARRTLDGEHRGQFDQVVGVYEAHVRLTGMVLDYADQAVYSDIWVRDLVGEMPYGGGAYIELGPQGAIGRVPPAVTSLNVQQDLANLLDSFHLGSRYPKSRPGEIDQSIASAKFLESSVGMMNTVIRSVHQIFELMFERALRVAFKIDQTDFGAETKSMRGVMRNQSFVEEYTPSKDIDLTNDVRVEYGLGLGRSPQEAAMLHLQYANNGYISREFVMENIEGLNDVGRERRRIDVEKLTEMAFVKLMQGMETGSIPDKALVEIAQARERGEDLFSLYRKYVVEPAEDTMMLTNGQRVLPGLPAGAGPAPGAPAAALPPAPDGAGLLAGLLGGELPPGAQGGPPPGAALQEAR